jgi:hypothetical protein
MDQNSNTRTISETIDNEMNDQPTKRRRVNNDVDELKSMSLPDIIYTIQEAASYFEREIGRVERLTRPGSTLYREYDVETNFVYIFEKMPRNTSAMDPSSGEYEREKLLSWSAADTAAIAPLKKKLEKSDTTVHSADGRYTGYRHLAPFSIQWTKNESDDIRLAESITGATTSSMANIMENYVDYVYFLNNNRRWKALFVKMLEAEHDRRYGEDINTTIVQLPTIPTVRSQTAAILRTVNDINEKMGLLYNMISPSDELTEAQRVKEAKDIIELFRRSRPVDDGGRFENNVSGGLICETIGVSNNVQNRRANEAENDLQLIHTFGARNGDAAKQSSHARIQALTAYLIKHLRYIFTTSQLPIYVPKPAIEFTDKWKGLIRDSMVRYTTGPLYSKVIESYRDILRPEPNDSVIALFAEFVSKRADNTQVTMRPLNNAAFALTRFQLSRNTVQYKAKEKEMDTKIRELLPSIRKLKR